MAWTDERIESLKKLWAEGLSEAKSPPSWADSNTARTEGAVPSAVR